MKNKTVLFVCTGNTCRSVMAQALFQGFKEDLFPELNYQADSAGIAASGSTSPSREAIFCLAKQGMDITTHQPKPVNSQLLKDAILILTMTQQQLDYLREHFPWAKHKMYLFRTFCQQMENLKVKEIEDPYGMGLLFYEDIYEKLENDIKNLLFFLKKVGNNE